MCLLQRMQLWDTIGIYIQNKNTCIHSDSDISVTLASWLGKNDVVKPEGWQYQ